MHAKFCMFQACHVRFLQFQLEAPYGIFLQAVDSKPDEFLSYGAIACRHAVGSVAFPMKRIVLLSSSMMK